MSRSAKKRPISAATVAVLEAHARVMSLMSEGRPLTHADRAILLGGDTIASKLLAEARGRRKAKP
ncbi:MAG: hypothetical protein WDM94_07225 [Bauldia sp.]